MFEEDAGARGPPGKRPVDRLAAIAAPPAAREIVEAHQDETGADLGPAVAQHPDADLVERERAGPAAADVMIPGHAKDAERSGEGSQRVQELPR